ncbi:YhgE/Pip domain-containing protein [Neobacillus sp. OS1-33]|uniref:YhgE/Pip domain-containing protein n=1 Tax=Neobacillus sp. OS1-33 TaxID=3070683 RepID=UPI0027DF87BE|nr:YhgE/Pip domain-containing protein [Neobacillus sp. OS1-33]WML27862.1 YhgE/Pip domain-containing protein [Neobacillus sp. OS1-33]
MKNILFKEELLAILRNKKLLIPIIAVMFVPVLYAGMFLWAFWDPYDKLDDLPVAIVNEDTGATLDGNHLKLGDELVSKLKKNKQFGFEFVNKEEGYQNLKDQKYYMVIEIPKSFSKNATTLLDEQPEKLELIYTPNEGYNFLSAQIGGTAIEKIKTAVAEKVTETYAETMFDKISELADGVVKASDGAGQLSAGTLDLDLGSKELNKGLATLAEKSIEFNDGMKSADAGSNKLAVGSKELYNGLATLADKSIEFDNGVKEAATGSRQVATGSTELKNGLAKADANLPLLIAGTKEASAGAEQLKRDLPAGIASGIEKELTGSVGELNAGIDQFQSQLTTTLASQIADQTISQQTEKMQKLAQTLIENKVDPALVQGIMANEQKNAPTKEQVEKQILSQLSPKIDAGFNQFKTGVDGKLAGSSKGLEDKIKAQTTPYFDQLITGIGKINGGQQELQKGIHDLYVGSSKLADGTNNLSAGMSQLAAGADKITTGTGKLATGSGKLKAGASDLTDGMNQLTGGASALTSGAGQLAKGSGQLKDGTSKLSNGAKELADKLSDGSKEVAKVHSDEKTYNMMADPVKLDKEKINHVPNYGTGFAPYFLSLGLFVGALLLSIVFPLRDTAVAPANGFNWFSSKFSIMAGIGVFQALLADVILLGGLGLDVQSVPKFILFSIMTSLAFIALIQLLVSVFADAGRFIAIVILILQLTTSAGTFPLELIPNFLQHFNAILPMTYSVQGFKAVISSGDFSFMWQNFMILLGYLIAFSLGTTAYFTIRYNHKYRHQMSE